MNKVVPFNFQGRLDRFLRRYFPHLPQSLLEKHIRKGEVKKNHKRTKSHERVFENDIISYPTNFETFISIDDGRIKDPYLYEQFQKLKVFENEEFCIISKPYNIASQGGSKIKYSIDDMANAGANPYFLVHRLDKQTTGLLILAKNSVTANVFMHQFREKKIQKYYIALVSQRPEKDSGVIDLPLIDAQRHFEKSEGSSSSPLSGSSRPIKPLDNGREHDVDTQVIVDFAKGKESRTRYRLIGPVGAYFALILKPYTGRKHQIRVHLKEGLNASIVGDEKYGGISEKRMYLQAYKVKLPHFDHYQTIKIPCAFLDH